MKAKKIALAFSSVLNKWLTAAQLRSVVRRNKTEGYANACATHDFCDANMAMDEAFRKVMKRKFRMNSDADIDLWNKGWTIARTNQFKLSPIAL